MIRKFLFAAGACVWLAFLASPAAALADQEANSQDTYRLLSLFGDVFEKVRSDYVEPVSDQQLIEAALNGMLSSLDPHSGYLNASNFKDFQVTTKGEFGGLGIEVTMENGWVKVISPIDDTPAAHAGIQPNDLITHLDGESVQGMTLNDAVERMRGAPNTDIRLTVQRGKRPPFDITLTRAVIKIQTVKWKLIDKVGYVRITQFTETSDDNLLKALAGIKKKAKGPLEGYVLDLRNNPGGLLDQAVRVAGDFLDRGEIVSTRARHPEDTQRFNAHGPDLLNGAPLVVLINDGSASASEIVAGALKDHRRATLMGTRSFGKGSVQTIIPLPGHGAIRLTTARYYTPSGRSIQAVGIEPDIVVPPSQHIAADAEPRRSEAGLKGALHNDTISAAAEKKLLQQAHAAEVKADHAAVADAECGKPSAAAAPPIVMGDPASDYQLARAIALLHERAAGKGPEPAK